MAEILKSFYFCVVFSIYYISLALPQDGNQFIYNGFHSDELDLIDATVRQNGLLQLGQDPGFAFSRFPIKFNTSSTQSLSFSTNFVFAIVPEAANLVGHGMAFLIAPSTNFTREAASAAYLGLFNATNNGLPTNHILAVELDTALDPEFKDVDGNHVGIDVNSVISIDSATAAYFDDKEGKNKTLEIIGGSKTQIWIEYNGAEKLLSVTLAPTGIPKPSRPLLSTSIDLSQILLDTMYIGFSASTGIANYYVLGWSFNTNGPAQDLNIKDLPSPPETAENPVPAKSSTETIKMIIVWIVAVVVVLMTISGAVYIVRKKRYDEIYEDWEREYGPQRFRYKKLYKATKGFRDREIIGKGGFGKVYRGVLPTSNLEIAVKKISHDSKQGMKEFVAEIVSMGKLRHRNLVKLCGYCRLRGELLLVYDYMPNGSLDKFLYSDNKPVLDWFQRFRILRGVASGLFYLHEEWEQVVLHRDIKPGNVLLDADLNGKLGDFGLARLHDHGSNPETTKLVGTVGYMAPELPTTGKASTSIDVYAFGVLMLEVATAKRPLEQRGYVIDCWRSGTILDASDPRLEGAYAEDQMELVLKLGLLCSHSNPTTRPSMTQVMQYLDGDAKLPDIPSDHVIDFFSSTSQSSDVKSFSSSHSAQIMSATDSILEEGR